MKPKPYRLRSFQGVMITLVVDEDKHWVVALSNKVSFVDAVLWTREEFEHDYEPVSLVADGVQMVLRQFRGYAEKVGMTSTAGLYLPKLIDMDSSVVHTSLNLGLETLGRIKKEAKIMAQANNDPLPSGKAPRKLAGAAAAAVRRKEERLAAEAKLLAEQVSTDKVEEEKAGTTDARLPTTAVKRSRKKADKAETGDKLPAVTETTPKTKKAAQKILKGDKPARKDSQVKDGQFDPAKLKNAEGQYRSSSAMFKGLLWANNDLAEAKRMTDDQIAKAVDKQFGLGEQKAKDYVKWNRGWFRREGLTLVDAKK